MQGKRISTLPEVEALFAAEYLANGGDAGAAYRATHPLAKNRNGSQVNGGRWLRRPTIQKLLAEAYARQTKTANATRDEKLELLTDLIRNPALEVAARLKALDLHNKMQGEYVDKVEHRFGSLEDIVAGVPAKKAA